MSNDYPTQATPNRTYFGNVTDSETHQTIGQTGLVHTSGYALRLAHLIAEKHGTPCEIAIHCMIHTDD